MIQLRAFARVDALWLAGLWILSFGLVMMKPTSGSGLLLAMSTPAMLVWRTVCFRDGIRNGHLSYWHACYYALVMVIHAVLILAVAQFVYFKWIDGGSLTMMLQQIISQSEDAYKTMGVDVEMMYKMLEDLRHTSPLDITFALMCQNLIAAIPCCFLSALIGRKK